MISEKDKKSIFVCWMTEKGNKNPKVNSLIEYLEENNLLNTSALPDFLKSKSGIIEADDKAVEEYKAKLPDLSIALAKTIVDKLSSAPPSQLDPELSEKCGLFLKEEHTLKEYWDFILFLHEQPEPLCSSFVRTLCDLKSHYKEP